MYFDVINGSILTPIFSLLHSVHHGCLVLKSLFQRVAVPVVNQVQMASSVHGPSDPT